VNDNLKEWLISALIFHICIEFDIDIDNYLVI